MRMLALALALAMILAACATELPPPSSDPVTGAERPPLWGAKDFCKRNPEDVRCR